MIYSTRPLENFGYICIHKYEKKDVFVVMCVYNMGFFFVICNRAGLYVGFLLPSILDGPSTGIPEATGGGDTLGRFRIHQKYLGTGYVLRK